MISSEDHARNRDADPNSHSELLVLICTYNERETLPVLVEQLLASLPHANILVVDDCSPDGTYQWVIDRQRSDPRLYVLVRAGKQGLGTAIHLGMNFAVEAGYQWLINLDGDLSHDPVAIHEMIKLQNRCDLAIGSRYIQGGGMKGCSWRRVFVSRCANVLARAIVGWKIQDCSSAYRMYRVELLKTIPLDQIQAKGYGFLEEVLAMILKAGGRVIETPIVYTERQRGKSKLSLREAASTLRALLRIGRSLRKQNVKPS
jgi:dolichol-phosphate mannosyltransferase